LFRKNSIRNRDSKAQFQDFRNRDLFVLPLVAALFVAGMLAENLATGQEGQYTLALTTGTATTRYRFLKQLNNGGSHRTAPIASKWVNDGILTLWDAQTLLSKEPPNGGWFWWIVLSLLVFLSSLLLERALPPWKYLPLSISRRLGLQNHT